MHCVTALIGLIDVGSHDDNDDDDDDDDDYVASLFMLFNA
jgi:hypothetical protein